MLVVYCSGKGGGFYWGPRRMCKGRHWRWASLSIGTPLGNVEAGSFTSKDE